MEILKHKVQARVNDETQLGIARYMKQRRFTERDISKAVRELLEIALKVVRKK